MFSFVHFLWILDEINYFPRLYGRRDFPPGMQKQQKDFDSTASGFCLFSIHTVVCRRVKLPYSIVFEYDSNTIELSFCSLALYF
jgi:hypothetical protein